MSLFEFSMKPLTEPYPTPPMALLPLPQPHHKPAASPSEAKIGTTRVSVWNYRLAVEKSGILNVGRTPLLLDLQA